MCANMCHVSGFTTIQNYTTLKPPHIGRNQKILFYYHTKLHYSQTTVCAIFDRFIVLLPYKITLLSNLSHFPLLQCSSFYYHTKLHYSQTFTSSSVSSLSFYYHTKLHYSQTISGVDDGEEEVLLPYKITLLSNFFVANSLIFPVLLPYKITLLSNFICFIHFSKIGFTTIQNYTTLKLLRAGASSIFRFTTIQNYTTLKPDFIKYSTVYSFTTIQNYTTLKL